MRTSFKRLLSLILAFAILFCAIPGIFATEVDAATVTMTEYSSYIGTTWFKWYTQYPGYGSTVFDTGDYWTDTIAYFTVNDGRTAFCVEPHVPGVTGTHTSVSWEKLELFKRNGIALALAYGAPNNGKTSEDAIYATAAVVWDMACGYRNADGSFMYASGVGTLTSSPFASALASYKPGAYAEYNAILANIANHGTIPSFAGKSKYQLTDANKITLKFNASNGKYEASVTDTNGVLENFNFISPLNGLTFSKNGNTLKISATAEAAANLQSATTIVNRGNEVEVSPDLCTLWQPSNGQTVCTLDVATDPIPCYFNLLAEPTTGNLRFVKNTNTGAGLAGWYFDLYKDRACTVKVGTYGPTSGNGTFTATGLEPGTYYVKEVTESALYPYWDYDTTVHEVVITAGDTTDVTINNTHNGKLLIRKTLSAGTKLDGWQFRVTRLSDNTDMGIFTTGEDGTILTGNLLPVQYMVEEILDPNSPYYCEGENPVTVTVEAGKTTEVSFSNTLRKDTITVTKTGEVFTSVEETDGVYQPVYTTEKLAGAVFEVRAAEDIKAPDGTVLCAAGTLVDTITTGADGRATTKPLYLGKYAVKEVTAPDGMVNNAEEKFVTLTYPKSDTDTSSVTFDNQRQKVKITLTKTLEQDEDFGIIPEDEILSVTFGLYAEEELTAADGTTIPADGLLEVISCDKDGTATIKTDVPVDAKLYVQEIAAPEGYILADTKYPVEFAYAGQDVAVVEIAVNDGEAITNDLIRGSIIGKKVDEDGFAICGAEFGLFGEYETVFTEDTAILTATSNEIGVFGFENVPYGRYIVRELKPAPAFVLNETLYDVEITEDGEMVEITIENAFLVGSVQTVKVDAEKTWDKLSGATFEVYVDVDGDKTFDKDIDILVGEMEEIGNGVYRMDNLRYNGYFLHEKEAPSGFVKDDGYYYFEIRTDGEVVTVENKEGVGFTNAPGTGDVYITKTDITDGKPLANVGFRIRNEAAEVVAEVYTDKDGLAKFTLRTGKYTYQEIAAPEGYILDSTVYPFEIKEDGDIIKATVTNTPIPETPQTGDHTNIVMLMALLLLSGVGIATTVAIKKRRLFAK